MLKKRLTAAQYAELDKALQAAYKKAEGSDNYTLEIEDDDAGELKKAKDREKARADKAEKDRKAAEDRVAELEAEQEAARAQAGKGLDEAGVQKLKDKHAADLKKLQDQAATAKAALTKVLVDEAANKLAGEISTIPELLADKIKARLRLVEEADGTSTVKVVDEDGNVTDKKIEDLRQEFVANPKLAPIIVASKASGGGASGGNKSGGATKKTLAEMTATEEAEFANKNPEAYKQMVAEATP